MLLVWPAFGCGSSGQAPAASSPSDAVAVPTSTIGAPSSTTAAPTSSGASISTSPTTSPNSTRDRGEVIAVIDHNRDKFRACYDQARSQTPTLKGSFVLDFTINPDGTVKESHYDRDRSEIKDEGLGTCASASLRTLAFPPSKTGKESHISYPFGFSPGGAK